MTVLPHGVDSNFFNPDIESSFREKYDIPDDKFLVLSVGTINISHKRMHWIINEIASLKEKPYLVIIGEEDSESPWVKRMGKNILQDNIRFLRINHSEIPQAYRAADLFVLASLTEAFGIVFLEAMATGLPVIAHAHPSQKWILGDSGLTINMEKEGELTSTIGYLMENKEEARILGKKARERVEKTFSWNVLIPKYIDMYKKIQKANLVQ
jgi:glycosyltransferase involved in cell wall biosynthesis